MWELYIVGFKNDLIERKGLMVFTGVWESREEIRKFIAHIKEKHSHAVINFKAKPIEVFTCDTAVTKMENEMKFFESLIDGDNKAQFN